MTAARINAISPDPLYESVIFMNISNILYSIVSEPGGNAYADPWVPFLVWGTTIIQHVEQHLDKVWLDS